MSPNTMANFLAKVLDCNSNMTNEEEDLWNELKVHPPVVNTITIVTPNGDQFLLNVKKVNK